jgi:hypothetical protein
VGLSFIAAFQSAGIGSGRDFKSEGGGNAGNQNLPAAQKLSITGDPFTFPAELSPSVRHLVILHAVPTTITAIFHNSETHPDQGKQGEGKSRLKKSKGTTRPVERLFPFVLRARILLVGRGTLYRNKRKLHFVLITGDIAENIRAEVLSDFAHYPVVQHFTAADLEKFFGIKGAKAIGFVKSGLAQSIYAELKAHRINQPVTKPKPSESPPNSPGRRS